MLEILELYQQFFFFQAEDGIRDYKVLEFRRMLFRSAEPLVDHGVEVGELREVLGPDAALPRHLAERLAQPRQHRRVGHQIAHRPGHRIARQLVRSEERRVGKEGRSREWESEGKKER